VQAELVIGDRFPAPKRREHLTAPSQPFAALRQRGEPYCQRRVVEAGHPVGSSAKPHLEAAGRGGLGDGELFGEQERMPQRNVHYVHSQRGAHGDAGHGRQQ
jgi:hypothetical protein